MPPTAAQTTGANLEECLPKANFIRLAFFRA